jgi:uncharacterized membrane-anchored protein
MKRNLFILVLLLQSAWVLYTVAMQETALSRGTAILLETRPVDPRDLLRGDYVILNYKISDVPTNLFQPALTNALPPGRTVYVALQQRGEFHQVAWASIHKIPANPHEVILKGTTQHAWNSERQGTVHIAYGLERYFVREGTGEPRGTLTVQAVVPASGRASIKQVFLDGRPYAEAMREMAR